MGLFERFTEQARNALRQATEEARTLKHKDVGTGHVLLGLMLLRDDGGPAAEVLESLDITVERVRGEVGRVVGVGEEPVALTGVVRIVGGGTEPASRSVPLAPETKKVLEQALRESLSLGQKYIGH